MRKDYAITWIRVLAMTLVVLYHSICCYTPIWAGIGLNIRLIEGYTIVAKILSYIHVPIFFLISGYLYSKFNEKYKKNGNGAFVLKKIKRLLIPYAFWGLFLVSLGKEPINFFKGISHLWFLMTLFEFAIVWHLCFPFFSKYKIRIVTSILYVVLYIVHVKIPFFQYFSLHMFIEYSPYYIVGFFCQKKIFHLGGGYAISMFVIICVLSIIAFVNSSRLIELSLRCCSIVLCVSFFSCLENMLNKKNDNRDNRIIVYLGSLSMGVYIIHHIVIQEVLQINRFIELASSHYICFPILLFFSSYVMSVLFAALILKSPLKGVI